MSPEQVQGKKELDGRSDLYSLGVMLYRCFSGQLPFNAEEIAPLLMQILVDVPRSLREAVPELDRELVTLVTRAMARRPEDRFQTAGEFLTALVAWEQTHAADLDAPLVPVGMTAATRTGQHGTAASWSRVTEASTPSGSRIRTLALTVSLLVAGVVGVLVAVKLWTTPKDSVGLASTSATALVDALPANAGQVPSPDVTPVTAIPRGSARFARGRSFGPFWCGTARSRGSRCRTRSSSRRGDTGTESDPKWWSSGPSGCRLACPVNVRSRQSSRSRQGT